MSMKNRHPAQELPRNLKRPGQELEGLYDEEGGPRSRAWRWVILVGSILCVGLVIVIGGALIGYYDGLREREEYLRTQGLEHYRLGLLHAEAGEYELAEAELEECLRLQPDLGPAWDKLREVEARLQMVPTPTSSMSPDEGSAAMPEVAGPDVAELLATARALYDQGNYSGALDHIQQLLEHDPQYEREGVAQLLFECYAARAAELVEEGRFEEAVRHFDLALQLRPDDAALREDRDLASGYVSALGYWAADWEKAAERFSQLYQMRPGYKDVASRLYTAEVEYAGQLREEGSWCDAREHYDRALAMRSEADLATARDQMADYCARNVPPPTADQEEGTSPAAGTSPATTNASLRELGLRGTIYYAVWDRTLREYVLYRVSASGGTPVEVVVGMHQPQVDRTGTHLVARARSGVKTLGLYLIDLTSARPEVSLITSHVDDLYPSFSPDGAQILFTSNRMSQRIWTLFTTWVGGDGELTPVTEGNTPAWGPARDILAYKGCDEHGNNCGIYTISPDGSGKTRIVADPSAGFPAWSPDGRQIAFMSNRDGNWEIYLVGVEGQGLRRLTRSQGSDGLPAWSPDGKGIAYVSDRDGRWGIYLQRPDTGGVAKLVTLDTTYDDWLIEAIAWGR